MTSLTDAVQHHSNKHQSHDVAYQGPPSFSLLESIPMGNGFILSSGQDERVSLRPLCPVRVANIPELRSHSYQKWIQGIQLEAAAGEILGINQACQALPLSLCILLSLVLLQTGRYSPCFSAFFGVHTTLKLQPWPGVTLSFSSSVKH